MRTRFMHVAILLALATVTTVTAVSCSPDAAAPEVKSEPHTSAQSLEGLKQKYQWMGDYHTQALVEIRAKLSEKKNSSLGKAEKCRVAMAALKEFHKAFRRGGKPLTFSDVSTVDSFCDTGDFGLSASVSAGEVSSPLSDLSGAAASHMTQIEQAVDADVSRSEVESSIVAIQSSAAATLPPDEAGAVVGLGSIALSSIAYWDENLESGGSGGPSQEEAYTRFAPAGPSLSVATANLTPRFAGLSPRGRAMIKADISAALSTLLYEWWLGAVAIEKAVIRGAAASLIAGLLY